MKKKISEYIQNPKWIENITPEEQHEWYLLAKRDLPRFKKMGDASDLENAIIDYEKRHGIQ